MAAEIDQEAAPAEPRRIANVYKRNRPASDELTKRLRSVEKSSGVRCLDYHALVPRPKMIALRTRDPGCWNKRQADPGGAAVAPSEPQLLCKECGGGCRFASTINNGVGAERCMSIRPCHGGGHWNQRG